MSKPYKCPICGGTGHVPCGFYNGTANIGQGSSLAFEMCQSCHGTGIIWSIEYTESPQKDYLEIRYVIGQEAEHEFD